MELTLKQARLLEVSLRNFKIGERVIKIRSYDSDIARSDIENGVDDLDNSILDGIQLNEVRHRIKGAINETNMSCGVSALLNNRDELYALRDLIGGLGLPDTVDRQVEAATGAEMLACVYTEESAKVVDQDLKDVQNELQEIYSKLNDLNNTVTIQLDEVDVELLTYKGYL